MENLKGFYINVGYFLVFQTILFTVPIFQELLSTEEYIIQDISVYKDFEQDSNIEIVIINKYPFSEQLWEIYNNYTDYGIVEFYDDQFNKKIIFKLKKLK